MHLEETSPQPAHGFLVFLVFRLLQESCIGNNDSSNVLKGLGHKRLKVNLGSGQGVNGDIMDGPIYIGRGGVKGLKGFCLTLKVSFTASVNLLKKGS